MDKKTFKEKLKAFIEGNNVGVANKFPKDEDNVAVVAAVEDFDISGNDMWDKPENKSYPRDLHCTSCSRQVVMSEGMFKMFEEANPKPKVICTVCLLKSFKKEDTGIQ